MGFGRNKKTGSYYFDPVFNVHKKLVKKIKKVVALLDHSYPVEFPNLSQTLPPL